MTTALMVILWAPVIAAWAFWVWVATERCNDKEAR